MYMGVIEVSMGITEQFRLLSIHEIEISLLNILAISALPSNLVHNLSRQECKSQLKFFSSIFAQIV